MFECYFPLGPVELPLPLGPLAWDCEVKRMMFPDLFLMYGRCPEAETGALTPPPRPMVVKAMAPAGGKALWKYFGLVGSASRNWWPPLPEPPCYPRPLP